MHYPTLKRFYNESELKTVFVTMDVDWAPDFVLNEVLSWFVQNKIALTVFMTHPSDVFQNYLSTGLIEVGIHPNVSRGKSPLEAIKQLSGWYPDAQGSRGHRNMCGRDFTDSLKEFGLKYDVSKLLWGCQYAECTPFYNKLIEAPYVWEDGVHLEMGYPLDTKAIELNTPGLKIINFHPVLFYLNCSDDMQRKTVVSKYADLTKAPEEVLEAARRPGFGVGDMSKDLLLNLKSSGVDFFCLNEMMNEAFVQESKIVGRVANES